jgi:hypothetical protein
MLIEDIWICVRYISRTGVVIKLQEGSSRGFTTGLIRNYKRIHLLVYVSFEISFAIALKNSFIVPVLTNIISLVANRASCRCKKILVVDLFDLVVHEDIKTLGY